MTSLASIFPAEEAHKASKRVHDTLVERQTELDQVRGFIADNTNLINQVQRLPDELYHDIMVPFGKAAFLPGRLIHTNEFLVLLGEGYYAERTSKQTVEILQRRGKVLESQVESLKAIMLDLKTEASFFDSTASEAAEGIVEIREDYMEENSAERMSKEGLPQSESPSDADNKKVTVDDEEFARMMSRFDELEKEELEAERANNHETEQTEDDISDYKTHHPLHQSLRNSAGPKLGNPMRQSADEFTESNKILSKDQFQHVFDDQLANCRMEFEGLRMPLSKDKSPNVRFLAHNEDNSDSPGIAMPTVEKENAQRALSKNEGPSQTFKPSSDSLKAFTGSIVEHKHNLPMNQGEFGRDQSSSIRPPKPVSRFKMQRK